MKRVLGYIVVLVGITGIILSALGTLGIVRAADWIKRNVPPGLHSLELTLASLSEQLRTVSSNLDYMDDRLQALQPALEELSRDADDRPQSAALQQSFDRTVMVPLRNVEVLTLSAQQSIRSLSSTLLLLDSVPLFSRAGLTAGPAGETSMKSVAASLQELAESLQQINDVLAGLRTSQRPSDEQLLAALRAVVTARSTFERLREQTQYLAFALDNAETRVAAGPEKVRAWLTYGRAGGVLFCVCFGCTQLSLLRQGIKLARGRQDKHPGRAAA